MTFCENEGMKAADGLFFCRKPKNKPEQSELCSDVVRLTGVEPVRPYGHKHLKLASLPIPAQPQRAVQRPLDYYTVPAEICQRDFSHFSPFPPSGQQWPPAPSSVPHRAGGYPTPDWKQSEQPSEGSEAALPDG